MKEAIILPAWNTITEYHSLKKLNFIPSLVGMIWLFCILIYQATFAYVNVFHKQDEVLSVLAEFAHKSYFFETLIALGSILLLYILLEPIATGAIIQMIDTYKRTQWQNPHRTLQGIFDGMRHFVPIFEVQNLISIFRPLTIITFYILLLRLFWKEYFMIISGGMGIYLLFSFFLNMCFAYSKFFIIFEGMKALESLSASTGMAVRHIHITGKLYFTMILLYLRTILVAAIFLVIPFAISAIITFFTLISVKIIFLTIFWLISLVFFVFIVHLNSTLEIFVEATWYEAYMLCKKEDAEYDALDPNHGHHGGHAHEWEHHEDHEHHHTDTIHGHH